MGEQEKDLALSGYRVLDLADAKGIYGTRMLADMGADVIKVEPPDGHPARKIPPFAEDTPGPDRSLYWLYRNLNKRGITLNIESKHGGEIFKRLIKTADVLVETFKPGYMEELGLDYEVLREINPGLIMASITDFGQTGPYSQYKGSDIVDFAMSGAMIINGLPEFPPVLIPGTAARDCGAIYAMGGVMLALFSRGATGQGQYVETSVQEAAIGALYPWSINGYSYKIAGGTAIGVGMRPRTGGFLVVPCKDGYANFIMVSPRNIQAVYDTLGNPPELVEYGTEIIGVLPRLGEFLPKLFTYTMQMTMEELCGRGQEEFGLPACPVYTPAEYMEDKHVKARGFFEEVEHPETGKGMYAGMPFKMTETPPSFRRPAPRLGEHNEEVYCEELDFSREELGVLRMSGII